MDKKHISKKVISLLLTMAVSITTLPLTGICVNADSQSAVTLTGQEINTALKKLAAEWDSSQADYIYNESARDAASGVTTIYSSEAITAKASQVVDERSEMQAEAELADEVIVEQVTDYTTEAVLETETQTETESYTEPEAMTETATEAETTTEEEYIPIIENVTNLNDETVVATTEETTEAVQYSTDTVDTIIQAIVWSEKAPVDGMNTVNLSEDGSIVAWYEPASVKEQADLYNGIDHINVTDPDGNTIKVYKEYYNTVYIYSYVDYADLYTYFNSDMSHAFENMAALSDISALSHFRTDKTENMSYMFANDYSLTDISPISGFNTSRLADVSYMFNGAAYLTDVREYMSEHTYDNYAEIKQSEANELKDLILESVSVENEDSLQISGLDATYEDSDGSYAAPYTAWSVSFYVVYEGALVNTGVEEYPEWVYRNEGLDVPYHASFEETENGSVSLVDSNWYFTYSDTYYKNDTVYFYAEGNEGYEVNDIVILDESGNQIDYSLEDEYYHVYSFVMPESNASITVSFEVPEPESETESETESTEEVSETSEEETSESESEETSESTKTTTESVSETVETEEDTEEITEESLEETAEETSEEITEEDSEETEEDTSDETSDETSEDVTDETEETSSEETTEEESTAEEVKKETEYPGVDISGIDTDDILSTSIFIAGTSEMLKEDTHVISSYNDTYILQFNSVTETAKAYAYYSKLEGIDFVAFNNDSFVISDDDDSLDGVIVDSAYEIETTSTEEITEVLEETTTDNTIETTTTETSTEETSEIESEEVTKKQTEETEEDTTTVVNETETEEESKTEEETKTDVPSNPLTELTNAIEEDSESNTIESYDIAIIDTGANGVDKAVSMIDDDPSDLNGHGTKMAQIISEQNPNARILSIKAFDENGKADISAIYAAFEYAMTQNVKIINLSANAVASEDNSVLEEVINRAITSGITVVGSAGNNENDAKYFIPSKIASALIIGAADENGARRRYSNYGDTVDYNVVASTTSEAAAKFTGWLSTHSISEIESIMNNGFIYETDYATEKAGDGNIGEDDSDFTINATWPKQTSNDLAGITLTTNIDWSGMDAWWPQSNGFVDRTAAWRLVGKVSKISELKPGDVVLWAEGSTAYWVNHIAIVVEVASDGSYFVTADGNQINDAGSTNQTGVGLNKRTNFYKRNSEYGQLLVWRNEENGDIIARSVEDLTRQILEDNDTSMAEQFSSYNWCFSFVVSVLLSTVKTGEKITLQKLTNPSDLLTIDKTLYSIDGAVFQLFTDTSATTPYTTTTGGNEYYIGFKIYKNTSYMARCLTSEDPSNRDNWALYKDIKNNYATYTYVDSGETYSVKEIIAPSSGLYEKDNSIVVFEDMTSAQTFTFTDSLRYGYIALTKNTTPSNTKTSTNNAVYAIYTSNGRLYNDGTYYYGFRMSNGLAYAVRCSVSNNTKSYSNWSYISTSDSSYSIPSSVSGSSKGGYYLYVKVPAADTTTAYSVQEIISPSNGKFNIDENSYSINVAGSKVSTVTSTDVEKVYLSIKKVSSNPDLSNSDTSVYDSTLTATFALYKTLADAKAGTNSMAVLTTDSITHMTESVELPSIGTYYAVEIYTPTGFIEDTTPFEIKVDSYGENTFIRSNTPKSPVKVTLKKTNATTGDPVSGATFVLYQWSVNSQKYVRVGNLVNNIALDYTVKEGQYSYVNDLYQTIDNQGKFVVDEVSTAAGYKDEKNVTSAATGEKVLWSSGVFTAGEKPTVEGSSYDKDTYTFTFNVTNEPNPVIAKLHKTSRDTSTIMDECKFMLYEWSTAKNAYVSTGKELTWVADSSDTYGGYYQTTELFRTNDNNGYFKVVETETMDGYKILEDGSATFSIDYYVNRGETSFFINDGVPMNNPEMVIYGKIVVKKYADSTSETPAAHDAVFKVYEWTGTSATSGKYDMDNPIDTLRYDGGLDAYVSTYEYDIHFSTDSTSYNAGKYMVVEEKSPSGTILGTDTKRYVTFTDTRPNLDTQTITLSGSQGYTNKRNAIDIEKLVTGINTRLKGVTFSISNGKQAQMITTDKTSDWVTSDIGFSYKCDDGVIHLREIHPGSYIVKETYAPDPYVIDESQTLEFTVLENGYINIDGDSKNISFTTEYVYNSVSIPLYITKQDDGTAVTGLETRTVADSGFPNGTEFTITEWDASSDTWSSTPAATLVYSDLYEGAGCQFVDKSTNMPFYLTYNSSNTGKYLIKETKATDGYIMDATEVTVQLYMNTSGVTYSINGGTAQTYDQNIKVEFTNNPNKLWIRKTDKSGNLITTGQAGFSIVNTETGERLGAVGTIDGIATFYRIPLGTWEVYEDYAPAGYTKKDGVVATFIMREDGRIKVGDNIVSTLTIFVDDSPETKLRITKADSKTDLQTEYYTGFPQGTKFNLSPYVDDESQFSTSEVIKVIQAKDYANLPAHVRVTFDGNGATTNTYGKQTYYYGTSGQYFAGTATRTGYTLLGWSTSSTATTATYGVNCPVADSWIKEHAGTITLYAVWKPETVTVHFSAPGWTSGAYAGSQTFTFGVSGQKFTGWIERTGYSFGYWGESTDSTSGYPLNWAVTDAWIHEHAGQTVNLYVKWIPN